ncbi:MAG: hypothetical protein Q9165_001525 [Trypethelium subeluteriae]
MTYRNISIPIMSRLLLRPLLTTPHSTSLSPSPIAISALRTLHMDPAPKASPGAKPPPHSSNPPSRPAHEAPPHTDAQSNASIKDTKAQGYGKEGTTSEVYGNEDVEAAIESAKPGVGQSDR